MRMATFSAAPVLHLGTVACRPDLLAYLQRYHDLAASGVSQNRHHSIESMVIIRATARQPLVRPPAGQSGEEVRDKGLKC
jgi:hypothetical protein